MSITKISAIFFLSLIALGCALPPEKVNNTDFVPSDDLLVAKLVQGAAFDYSEKRYQKSYNQLLQAAELVPNSLVVKRNLAQTALKVGSPGVALPLLVTLSQAKPIAPAILIPSDVWLGLGNAYAALGDYQHAIENYQTAVTVSMKAGEWPIVSNASKALSLVQLKVGDDVGARCSFDLALNVQPSPDDLPRYFDILNGTGAYQKIVDLATPMTKSQLTPALKHRLAMAYYGLGNKDQFTAMEDELAADEDTDDLTNAEIVTLKSVLNKEDVKVVPERVKFWPINLAAQVS